MSNQAEEAKTQPEKFVCEACGKGFDSEASLKGHMVKVHGGKGKIRGLYPEIRSPTEILVDILTEMDIPQNVVNFLARVSDAVGGIHPVDLFNRLKGMKTGLKSDMEVLDVVNLYSLELEKERQKAAELGKPFPFTRPIQPLTPSAILPPVSTYYPTQTYPGGTYYSPPAPSYPQYPSPAPAQPAPSYPQPPPLTEERVAALVSQQIARALAEKRTSDEITELRKMVTESIPRMMEEKIAKTTEALASSLKEKIEEVKALIPTQAPKPGPEITPKDLDLLKASFEKLVSERVAEAEKKVLEERLTRLEEKIEKKTQPIIPPSSEGYTTDQYRLVADTIKTVVKPGEWYPGRAISEVVIKLVPTSPPPERKEVRGGKSIVEKVLEAGGEVE